MSDGHIGHHLNMILFQIHFRCRSCRGPLPSLLRFFVRGSSQVYVRHAWVLTIFHLSKGSPLILERLSAADYPDSLWSRYPSPRFAAIADFTRRPPIPFWATIIPNTSNKKATCIMTYDGGGGGEPQVPASHHDPYRVSSFVKYNYCDHVAKS